MNRLFRVEMIRKIHHLRYLTSGSIILKKGNGDHSIVPIGHWHQISNPSNIKTHIIEIQYGEDCSESDIERVDIT